MPFMVVDMFGYRHHYHQHLLRHLIAGFIIGTCAGSQQVNP